MYLLKNIEYLIANIGIVNLLLLVNIHGLNCILTFTDDIDRCLLSIDFMNKAIFLFGFKFQWLKIHTS